ncbi:Gfo/Idh/MocA family protein [Cryobacterium sp. TMS1-13-1]|uniref:Gfo/Idh/MocA family protein n=1 Tax=Cryobacterium sp. TMS1-13-1 TaxID=1259220 RepID=UPI00106C3B12|nr:Gfo/Idh/MocA family oxidoreductase [Cryobacterium sp. TMS1-13-1]TFD25679.1 Gfo/Idh/MocA family oxidoreductase [Cryobacterium sp. TMS1-13-1]
MTRTGPVGIAIIGAGVISKEYLTNLATFPDVTVHVVADMFEEVAAARAAEFGIPRSGGVAAALEHPDVEIVINLTIPAAHVAVATQAVQAGKHVWSEKPFSLDRQSGRALLAAAETAGVRLGSAPDTFLGAGLQTARRMIERGDIGVPLTALTLMQSPGPESWHPNPAFLFQEGAGPLFDIGPYYLTTLIQTFGSIKKVAAFGSKSRATRVIGSGPKAGEEFAVTVPSHVSAIAQFESGESSQSIFSFDSPYKRHGFVEVTGTEATIAFPDPNQFDGDIRICARGAEEWTTVASVGSTASRGVGVLEMARAIREGRPHRAPGQLAYHVLDAMVSISESMESGDFVSLESVATPSEALPEDWDPTTLTVSGPNDSTAVPRVSYSTTRI